MYKWPEGKILRMSILLLLLIAAGDCAWQSYGEMNSWYGSGDDAAWQQLVSGGLLGVGALVFLLAGLLGALFIPKTVDWLCEVEAEMRRVTWPVRPEVIRSTIIIAIMTVLLASLIFVVDYINVMVVVENILQRGG